MNKSRCFVFFLFTMFSQTVYSGVLDDETNSKYRGFVACVKETSSPPSCLDEYVLYIKSALNVIKRDSTSSEKGRVVKSMKFMEAAADQYSAMATESGNTSLASKSQRIYLLLSKLDPSRLTYFKEKASNVNNIVSAQDISIKIDSFLKRFNENLARDLSPRDEDRSYLASIADFHDSLPIDLRKDIIVTLDRVGSWLTRYLDKTKANVLELEPSEFKDRVNLYRLSMEIQTDKPDLENFISGAEINISNQINELAKQAIADLIVSENINLDVFNRDVAKPTTDAVEFVSEFRKQKDVSNRLLEILSSAENEWVYFRDSFHEGFEVLQDRKRWDSSYEGLELSNWMYDSNLERSVAAFQSISSKYQSWVNESVFNKSTKNKIVSLFRDLYLKEVDESVIAVLSFLRDVDIYSHSTFLDVEIISAYSEFIINTDSSDSGYAYLLEIANSYVTFKESHEYFEEVRGLQSNIIEIIDRGVSSSGLKKIYEDLSLLDVMKVLQDIPSVVSNFDVEFSKRLISERYGNLYETDIAPVEFVKDFYLRATDTISVSDIDPYFDFLDDYNKLTVKKFDFDSYIESSRLSGYLRKEYEKSLPIKKDVLLGRYPLQSTYLCIFNFIAEEKNSDDFYNKIISGYDDYHPVTVSLSSQAIELKGILDLLGAFKDKDVSGIYPISPEEFEIYNFDFANSILKQCFGEYPMQ